jgi:prevent-host-death family protein
MKENMVRQIPISEARKRLNELHRELGPNGTLSITSRGKQVLALMPWDLYESLVETVEILGDPVLMKSLKKGARDIKSGRVTNWEKVKAELQIEL